MNEKADKFPEKQQKCLLLNLTVAVAARGPPKDNRKASHWQNTPGQKQAKAFLSVFSIPRKEGIGLIAGFVTGHVALKFYPYKLGKPKSAAYAKRI